MSSLVDNAYLNARVTLFSGRLLASDELEAWLDQPTIDWNQLSAKLILPSVDDSHIGDSDVVEQLLVSALVKEVGVLARPLRGVAHELLLYWLRRFEISNLKAILRGVVGSWPAESIHQELLDLGNLTALPVNDLIHTEDINELLRRLENSAYSSLARRARHLYEEGQPLFAVEAAFDREYYAGLVKRVATLPEAEKNVLQQLTGSLIDQSNLVWLLRYRLSYGVAPALAYFFLAPGGRQLNSQRLLQLVQLESFREIIEACPEALRKLLATAEDIEAVESVLRRETEQTARSLLDSVRFTLARPCAYLLLRERQLWRVHSILKGRHLGLNKSLIQAAMRLTA